jgi:hypothetical protein
VLFVAESVEHFRRVPAPWAGTKANARLEKQWSRSSEAGDANAGV